MKIKDYISNIPYQYIETYSLLRGETYVEFYNNLHNEINELETSIKELKFGWIKQTKRLAELRKYIDQPQYILTNTSDFHPTSEKKSVIVRDDPEDLLLNTALSIDYNEADDFESACSPTFRDALVFYDERKQIITALNICFECKKMDTNESKSIIAHYKHYQSLATFLQRQGHEI
ncbi:MAG: hypothetical protein K1X55_03095 [Chitinophagales bacterium]|nr:hypothetical protein [Chitinophagales bacterium]